MAGPGLDLLECVLEIVHRPSAAGAGNVFRLVETPSGCLHKLIFEI